MVMGVVGRELLSCRVWEVLSGVEIGVRSEV